MPRICFAEICNIHDNDFAEVSRILPKRFEKSQKYKISDDRKRCIGVGVLLIHGLGLTDENFYHENENGKPYADGFPPFSISHSGDFVVLAIGDEHTKEIGCDIEDIKEKNLKAGKKVFSESELSYVNEGDSVIRFHELWTKKEAIIKAFGGTIFDNVKNFSVLGDSCTINDKIYNFETKILNERYYFTVAEERI